ncbi:MAG: hypothetical protein KA712_07975 [Myxococcales bacterium]|nr:hypothetical protein [Myxococcales bacterium]
MLGGLLGNHIGEAYGVGGLGLVGTGSGGGGTGEGTIGLGNLGTIGKGNGGGDGLDYGRNVDELRGRRTRPLGVISGVLAVRGSLLTEFARWYLGEVRMNMFFMAEMDMHHLTVRGQERLKDISLRHVFRPLGEVFSGFSPLAKEPFDPELFVTSWMALQSSIPASLMLGDQKLDQLLRFQVGLFLEGLLKRP